MCGVGYVRLLGILGCFLRVGLFRVSLDVIFEE